jgi:hypothetical protein
MITPIFPSLNRTWWALEGWLGELAYMAGWLRGVRVDLPGSAQHILVEGGVVDLPNAWMRWLVWFGALNFLFGSYFHPFLLIFFFWKYKRHGGCGYVELCDGATLIFLRDLMGDLCDQVYRVQAEGRAHCTNKEE